MAYTVESRFDSPSLSGVRVGVRGGRDIEGRELDVKTSGLDKSIGHSLH